MMAKGMRVAKVGKRAGSNSAEDYLYSSEFLSPKVLRVESGTLATDSFGDASVIIPHDLGYSPVCFAYINPLPGIVNDNFPMPGSWGFMDNNFAFATSRINRVKLDLQSSGANRTYKFVCFIFMEPAGQDG